MASGDADANGIIDLTDKNSGWAIKAGNTGYMQEDFNMDGQVDNPDKNERLIENIGKYSQIPE
ncbi:MAG: hypothetical protein K8S16_03210 [Bacteroidales bacterium]|nr:hypothetical protein [Bacteroidales bacterium]